MIVRQDLIVSKGRIKKTILPFESKPNLHFAELRFVRETFQKEHNGGR